MVFKYFLPFFGYLFTFLIMSFEAQIFLILVKSSLSTVLMLVLFMSYHGRIFLTLGHKYFCVFFKVFHRFILKFRFSITYKLIFMFCMWKKPFSSSPPSYFLLFSLSLSFSFFILSMWLSSCPSNILISHYYFGISLSIMEEKRQHRLQ